MKHKKLLLALSIIIGISSINNCSAAQTSIIKKINLAGPSSVAEKANKDSTFGSSPCSEVLNDPIINSALGGFGNMLQGMNGNALNVQEQAKQQMDYAKQQANFSEKDE